MGRMKELLEVVYGGGDEAVEAATKLAGLCQWIPCTERVPEIVTESLSAVVIAWRPGQEFPQPAFVQLEHGKRVWKWQGQLSPTHWMPMPELPEAT